jgi:hypothetical protein
LIHALGDGLGALDEATGPTATDDELVSALTVYEGVTRSLDRGAVAVVAALDRRGSFLERGCRNSVTALADLLRWDRADARRRVIAAEQAQPRTGPGRGQADPRDPRRAATRGRGPRPRLRPVRAPA